MNEVKQKKSKMNKHSKQKIIRRNNAKLYPIYKMFSWDLLCFYSIEFLFYTITKQISASEVLIISACYILFKIIMQIPAVTITDMLGHKKSLIIGNSLIALYIVGLILSPNKYFIILSCVVRALGYDIKVIVETNLLYDSVSTKGGEGLYSKLESKGAGWYYLLDGVLCFVTGYLFVINNYLPMFICLGFSIFSIIISAKFKDVYKKEKIDRANLKDVLKEYSNDLRQTVKFIMKSNRLKSYIIFGAVFYGTITVIDIFRCDLLVSKGVSEEQYSMIFAILILLAGISVTMSRMVHKKFKNRTLTVISLTFITCCVIVGIVANTCPNVVAIPIIVALYTIMKMASAVWYVMEYKYLKNFTTEEVRNKIMFTYEAIGGVVTSLFAIIGSIILKGIGSDLAFLWVSFLLFVLIILSLEYMKPRFGLRPKEYKKEDIEFE